MTYIDEHSYEENVKREVATSTFFFVSYQHSPREAGGKPEIISITRVNIRIYFSTQY